MFISLLSYVFRTLDIQIFKEILKEVHTNTSHMFGNIFVNLQDKMLREFQ